MNTIVLSVNHIIWLAHYNISTIESYDVPLVNFHGQRIEVAKKLGINFFFFFFGNTIYYQLSMMLMLGEYTSVYLSLKPIFEDTEVIVYTGTCIRVCFY